MIAASAITIYVSYVRAEKQLQSDIQTQGLIQAQYLQTLLWQLDTQAIQSQLDQGLELDQFLGARVSDIKGEVVVQSGAIGEAENTHKASIPLYREENSGRLEIGSFDVEVSREGIWRDAIRRVTALLLISTIAAFLSLWLSNRSLRRNLLQPIVSISGELRKERKDWNDLDLSDSAGAGTGEGNELNLLTQSIYDMRDHILVAERAVKREQGILAQAAQLANLGYCTVDLANDRITACNEAYAEMHGKTAAEMLQLKIEKDILNTLVHPDDRQISIEVLGRIKQGESVEFTLRILAGAGDIRHIHAYCPASEDAGDNSQQIFELVVQDVTEFYKVEEDLRQAQKTEAIGKLTGGVAHDFNNILAVISGNLELLSSDLDDNQGAEFVGTAMNAVRRGATLTQQLLAFARKQPLTPEVIDPFQLIRDLEPLLQSSIGDGISLELVADGGRWSTRADRAQLESALINLVVNARDAMPAGGALSIEVSNSRLDAAYAERHTEVGPGQYVCIAITDSGEGMSPEVVEQAIEPFFTTKDLGKGTGMGLAMVYGFAKQSGGHLKLYSEIGQGTTIKLYLPRVTETGSQPIPAKEPQSNVRFDKLIVLVVEDETDLLKTVSAQLKLLGCTVFGASDGASAIKLAKETPKVELLLTDVILPGGMDGRNVAREFSAIHPQAKMLFMSGFTENSIIHNGRLDEGVVLLQKPFTSMELSLAIQQAFEADPASSN